MAEAGAEHGSPGRGWSGMPSLFDTLKAGWTRSGETHAFLLAAGIAYYAFLSFIPLLASAILTYGLAVDAQTVAQHAAELTASLPASAADLVKSQLEGITESNSGASGLGLIVSLALSLFGARVAAGGTIQALNISFGVAEERGFVKANLLAIAITIGALIAMGLVVGTTALVALVFEGSGGAMATFIVTGLAGLGGAILAYRIIPNRDDVHIRHAIRGAVPFAIGWMVASSAFGFYTANFGNYNATYGSLGAIVVLLTWLYLSAYLLLIGANIAAASMGEPAGQS